MADSVVPDETLRVVYKSGGGALNAVERFRAAGFIGHVIVVVAGPMGSFLGRST